MRKLVLVTVTFDVGNPRPSEKNHLVALNVGKFDHFTANEEMEMATEKAKLYYEMEFPHAKIISIVPSATISSDNVPHKKAEPEYFSGLLFTEFHPMSEIPEADPSQEDLSFYVLIDPDGWRKDFEKGYYNFGSKEWYLKNSDVKIDMEHARWTYLPLAARDKK